MKTWRVIIRTPGRLPLYLTVLAESGINAIFAVWEHITAGSSISATKIKG